MSIDSSAPTNSELEILDILWQIAPATAREVHNELGKTKKTGYTTTLKIIQNMFEKGMLSREPKGQTHIYSPTLSRETVQQSMLGGFVNRVFGGSAKRMILQALGNEQPDAKELEEIKRMIERIEKENK